MAYTKLPAVNGTTVYDAARDQHIQGGIEAVEAAIPTMAEIAADPALTGTYARNSNAVPSPGRRWVFFGDSITNGSAASNYVYSYSQKAIELLGTTRWDFIEAGTSGYTSTALAAHVPTVLAGYPDISGAVIMIGTNDAGGAVPLSTYSAKVAQIVAACQANGIPFVVCTVPPKAGAAATASARQAVLAYNTWIRLWVPTQGGQVAETFGALANPTTGDMLAAYDSGDGTHPNNTGHWKLAVAVAAAMRQAVSLTPRPSASPLALMTGQSIAANPLMSGTLGAGHATSWYEQPGGTGTAPSYSKIADTTGLLPAGQWEQMDFDGTASGGTRLLVTAPAALGGNVGDYLAITTTILVEDVTGTWEADCIAGTAGVTATVRDQSFTTKQNLTANLPGRNVGNLLGAGNTCWQIGPIFQPFKIPVGMTAIFFVIGVTVPTGKRLKVRTGTNDAVNLTTLGLAALAGGGYSEVLHIDGP